MKKKYCRFRIELFRRRETSARYFSLLVVQCVPCAHEKRHQKPNSNQSRNEQTIYLWRSHINGCVRNWDRVHFQNTFSTQRTNERKDYTKNEINR